MDVSDTGALGVLEELLNQAIARNDVPAIAEYLADEWVLIDANGSIIERSAFLQIVESGDLVHELMESDEWRVADHDGSGVVTARTRSVGTWKGEPFDLLERSTSVWVVKGQRKVCVVTQLTSLKGNSPGSAERAS